MVRLILLLGSRTSFCGILNFCYTCGTSKQMHHGANDSRARISFLSSVSLMMTKRGKRMTIIWCKRSLKKDRKETTGLKPAVGSHLSSPALRLEKESSFCAAASPAQGWRIAFAQFSASMNAVHGKWMRSNKMCLNLMKITMAENMKPKVDIASEFLAKVKELSMFEIADKSIAGNLMTELTSMKFDWSVSIHDHCDQMVNIAAKLKGMGMELPESWLVHLVINSLPPAEFGQFRVNYYTLKEKWSFKETKHLLVQEEAILKWGI
nr:UBN2 domain-containing protein [Ipomoea batatas]